MKERYRSLVYSYNPDYIDFLSKNFRIDSEKFPHVSRKHHQTDSVVRVGNVEFGPERFSVIAGPCGLESREQTLKTAARLKTLGASVFRGFLWKGRTVPTGFQGVGEKGVPWLIEVKEKTGLPINLEVLSEEQFNLVSDVADVFQIGSRNMQNYELLKAAGRAKRPIILKNGPGSDLEEFLCAAEYLLRGGNKDVILCLRGTKPFAGSGTRFTLDMCSFSVLKHLTHLPVIGDPTHPADHHVVVPSVSMGITACGADGLLIEVHQNPKSALTGRQQLLDCSQFSLTMEYVKRILRAVDRKLS